MEERKQMTERKERGITLIALVVTIIVLIILATVSINMVVGENGLIRKAEQARDAYEESSKREEEDMGQIIDEMEILLADGEAQSVSDKEPGELSGDGSKEKPYLIESIEDLVKFSEKVNGGETFENKVVKLKVNLDFNNDISYVNPKRTDYGNINGINETEELKVELTTGTGFKPIGTDSNNFNGTFDGGGHTIKNMYISVTDNGTTGLFGVTGEKSNIKNIDILKANIKSTGDYVGGLIGKSKGTVEKVTIREGSIEGNERIGGVVGYAEKATITACTNTGNITGDRYIGGIAGFIDKESTIENCSNNGIIVGNGIYSDIDYQYHSNVGGIAGDVVNNSKIINSSNHNIVKSTKGIDIGGIAGVVIVNSTISKCYNEGEIGILQKNIDEKNVGGICGDFHNSTVSQCFNKGEVNGEQSIGGIVGIIGWQSKALIENCYNTGKVTGIIGSIGGIGYVPVNTTGSEIKNSYNTGIVSATERNNNNIRRNNRHRKSRCNNSNKLLLFIRNI